MRRRVEEVLSFVGLAEHIDRMPAELSGGERRRVAIARAMAARPTLLLFDDPTSGLDPIIATTVDDEIVKCGTGSTSPRWSSRTRSATRSTSPRTRPSRTADASQVVPAIGRAASRATFMVLHEGRIRFTGTAAELLASEDAFLREFLFMTLPPW